MQKPKKFLVKYQQPIHTAGNALAHCFLTTGFEALEDEALEDTKARFNRRYSINHGGEVISPIIHSWGLYIEAVCPAARAEKV